MSHQPKISALIALDAGLLSEAGERRLRAHLSGCDVCQEGLAQIQTYERVRHDLESANLDELLAMEGQSLDWDKMDFALRKEARQISKASQKSTGVSSSDIMLGGLVLAAAAALLFLMWPSGSNNKVAKVQTPQDDVAPIVVAEVAQLPPGILSAKNGTVWVDGKEAALGTEVAEGSVIRTELNTVAHVSISSETGFVVGSDSEMQMLRYRETTPKRNVDKEGIVLSLRKGRVAQQVKTGSLYAVRSADYTVHVRGTHFEVQHDGEDIGVTLDEGRVEVTKNGVTVTTLDAPSQWHSAGQKGQLRPQGSVPNPRRLTDPLDALKHWTLQVKDNIDRLEVDGTLSNIAPSKGLSFLSPKDSLSVTAWNASGDSHTKEVAWVSEGVVLERMFKRLPTVSSDDLQAIVRPHRASFSLCFDRTLRRNPDFRSKGMKVRITVGRDGAVRRAKVSGNAPAALESCLSNVAKRLSFDKKHAGLSLVLPLNLRAKPR